MSDPTAIPAIKEAVVKTLQEAESLKGIKITDDKEPENKNEYIWIWKARAKREFKNIGPNSKLDELIEVFIRVVSIKGSTEVKPSEERAVEIFAAVEKALRANRRLNGTAFWNKIGDLEITPVIFDKKRGCHVIAVVNAKAQI